jgi:hypothetical protein
MDDNTAQSVEKNLRAAMKRSHIHPLYRHQSILESSADTPQRNHQRWKRTGKSSTQTQLRGLHPRKMHVYRQHEPDHCIAVLCYAPASQCKPDNCQAVLSYAVGSQREPGHHKMALSYAAGNMTHRATHSEQQTTSHIATVNNS